jgi:DNA-directed RNA polymerase subunit N (RpoN/RPB10)
LWKVRIISIGKVISRKFSKLKRLFTEERSFLEPDNNKNDLKSVLSEMSEANMHSDTLPARAVLVSAAPSWSG